MKIIAKQVPPEQQESPMMLYHEYPNHIAITGNRHFYDHVFPAFETAAAALMEGETPDNAENLESWEDLLDRYATNATGSDNPFLCEALELLTGWKYDHRTICGCCQSDWQTLFYPVDVYDSTAVRTIEAEYFNLGTEWTINDEYSIYCTTDDPRAAIAAVEDCNPEDVTLLWFDGWDRKPRYREEAR